MILPTNSGSSKMLVNTNAMKKIGNKPGSNTPQTHLLYAYSESPILKYEFQNNFRHARKDLNF